MIVPSSSMENLILEYVSTKSVLIAGQKFSGIVKLACPSLVKLPLLISAQQTRPNFLILPAEKSEDKYVFSLFYLLELMGKSRFLTIIPIILVVRR